MNTPAVFVSRREVCGEVIEALQPCEVCDYADRCEGGFPCPEVSPAEMRDEA
jgi:hypothetical protein